MIRAALYLRVSTDDQAERYGLAAQRHALETAAAARAYEIADVYADEGISGAMERRPQLDRLLADARAGRVQVVLTLDSSRLARDVRIWANVVHAFGQAGVRVEYLGLAPDDSPTGDFMRTVLAAASQFERAQIRERTQAGRLAKARSGRFVTGRWPYGYRYADGALRVDPGPAAVVADVFRWVADEGCSVRAAIRRLHGLGIVAPGGGARWLTTTLHRILVNPVYRGTALYNRRRYTPIEGRPTRITRKPETEWVTIPVPAIVPAELWARVQARLRATRGGRPAQRRYLLTGRLRCGVCGRRLYGVPEKRGRGAYRCASVDWLRLGLPRRCGLPQQSVARLEARVWAALVEAFRRPEPLVPHLERRATRRAVADVEVQSARAQLVRAIGRVERQIQRALDLLLDDSAPRPERELRQRVATLEGERRLLAERLARVDAAATDQARQAAQAVTREAAVR
ncbi:MAG TPA: recombinase family protein, partial [Methylomirabilota bacterium]|nr:recombinase family protein [Methylomirabilota bacterium]